MSRQRTIFGAVTACVPDDGSTAAASAGRRTARWIGLVRDPGARVDQVEADASVARDQLPAQRLGRVTGDGRGGRLQVGVSGPVAVPTLTFSCYASPAIAGSTVGRFDAVFASGFGWGGVLIPDYVKTAPECEAAGGGFHTMNPAGSAISVKGAGRGTFDDQPLPEDQH